MWFRMIVLERHRLKEGTMRRLRRTIVDCWRAQIIKSPRKDPKCDRIHSKITGRKTQTENLDQTCQEPVVTMAATSSEQPLDVSVFTAYLEPLLKKHSANELITYEDLSQSWSSANRTLGKQSSDQPSDQVESTVRKKGLAWICFPYFLTLSSSIEA